MAEPLLSVTDLASWCRTTIALTDAWASLVVEAASDLVRATARQPTWTDITAPPRARQIASHLAARTYLNPDSVQTEGSVGPLGGDRLVEELAKALHLTGAEITELSAMAPVGATGALWVQPVASGSNALEPGDITLLDNSGSDWLISYAAESDGWAFTA